jgi:RNA polymerase sigma-70 factor (ECF subfamily)
LTCDSQVSTDHAERVERFRALYTSCYVDVSVYCQRRVDRDRAADAVSETFLVAWRRLDEVPAVTGRLWLFGVARRALANQRRSTERQERLAVAIGMEPTPAVVAAVDESAESDRLDDVLSAVASLNDDDQELLRLVAWEELSHREIAEVFDCSINAVAIRIHRARARLAEALRKPQHLAGHVGDDERSLSSIDPAHERSNDVR